MQQEIRAYCDETCHLPSDRQKAMVLGCIWLPANRVRGVVLDLQKIKARHNASRDLEIKWTKVSKSGVSLYLDVLEYFFNNPDLHFRALVIPDKSLIDHRAFDQSPDLWYYKMYFTMLKGILRPNASYEIFIDVKDTRGKERIKKLKEVLANSIYDFKRDIVRHTQFVDSKEAAALQIADLLIGAVGFANRDLLETSKNEGKVILVKEIQKQTGYSLRRSTLLMEEKFNVFVWKASEVRDGVAP